MVVVLVRWKLVLICVEMEVFCTVVCVEIEHKQPQKNFDVCKWLLVVTMVIKWFFSLFLAFNYRLPLFGSKAACRTDAIHNYCSRGLENRPRFLED